MLYLNDTSQSSRMQFSNPIPPIFYDTYPRTIGVTTVFLFFSAIDLLGESAANYFFLARALTAAVLLAPFVRESTKLVDLCCRLDILSS